MVVSLGLKWIAEYHGPNRYADSAVVVVELTGDLHTDIAPLQSACAALWAQTGMNRSLEKGLEPADQDSLLTLGRAAADWTRSALNEVRGFVQDAGAERDSETVHMWVGFHDASLSRKGLEIALRSLVRLMNRQFDAAGFRSECDHFWQSCRRRHPDFQARIIMEAARSRGIPYAPAWSLPRYWRFGEGAKSRVLFESTSRDDSFFGGRIAGSKATTKNVLRSLGLSTPEFRLVQREDEIAEAAQAVGFPCVTKPIDRGGGKGVSAGLLSVEAAQRGFQVARAASAGPILIEAHLEGEDHRLMVVEGKLVAAIRREPPSVTGDGKRTIRELVAEKNIGRDPRLLVRSGYLRAIQLDASADLHLSGQGLSPDTVLAAGQTIRLRSNGNLSTGGVCIDVTQSVHPEIRALAESMAQTLGIEMLGADYLAIDISKSPQDVPGGFIEINLTPGLAAMIAAGWPTAKAGALALTAGVGTLHKTLIVVPAGQFERLVNSAKTAIWPSGIGWAAQDRAAVAGAALAVPKAQGWAGIDLLLNHRAVRQAIILISDQQILRLGMPVARVDHLVIAANLPPVWERVLTAKTDVTEVPGPSASPDELVAKVLQQIGARAKANNEVLA